MRVLVACEYSGVVRDAFAARGHEAWSCDILPTEAPGNHYQCDVREVLCLGWDIMIAHPPCTYLCNSGVCHLHTDETRWDKMRQGAEFFKLLLDAPIPRKAIENPVMHKYAVSIIGKRFDQSIQPYQFGHGESKRTCLWLHQLPPLHHTNLVAEREQRLHRLSPSPERAKLRSRTYDGIAQAMAKQWGIELPYQMSMFDMLKTA